MEFLKLESGSRNGILGIVTIGIVSFGILGAIARFAHLASAPMPDIYTWRPDVRCARRPPHTRSEYSPPRAGIIPLAGDEAESRRAGGHSCSVATLGVPSVSHVKQPLLGPVSVLRGATTWRFRPEPIGVACLPQPTPTRCINIL